MLENKKAFNNRIVFAQTNTVFIIQLSGKFWNTVPKFLKYICLGNCITLCDIFRYLYNSRYKYLLRQTLTKMSLECEALYCNAIQCEANVKQSIVIFFLWCSVLHLFLILFYNSHIRDISKAPVNAELIKKGRLWWWDAQLKERRRSPRESEPGRRQLYCRVCVLLR